MGRRGERRRLITVGAAPERATLTGARPRRRRFVLSVPWSVFAALGGCVRVLELETSESGSTPAAPPEMLCVPGSALGYALPSARWGLAAAYASRRLDDRPTSALRLSPAWFLASGWQISGFDCAAYGPPWVAAPDGGPPGGCLAIDQGTLWNELCRLFPGEYACDGYDGALVGDAPEASTLALAWFAVAAHGLLGRFDLDPDDWYAAAGDPAAVELVTATMHFRGPWASEVDAILAGCADRVTGCLSSDLANYVLGVEDKLPQLAAAECYDAPLDPDEVTAFVDGLARARPAYDWAPATGAALAALDGSGFAREAPRVLDAIDEAVGLRLTCPEQELYTWYRLPCP